MLQRTTLAGRVAAGAVVTLVLGSIGWVSLGGDGGSRPALADAAPTSERPEVKPSIADAVLASKTTGLPDGVTGRQLRDGLQEFCSSDGASAVQVLREWAVDAKHQIRLGVEALVAGAGVLCPRTTDGQPGVVLDTYEDALQALAATTTTTTAPAPTTTTTTTTSTTVPPTTTTAAPTTTAPPTTPPPAPVQATGTLDVVLFFSPEMLTSTPAPTDCNGWGDGSYQVQVRDGGQTVLTLAQIDGGTFVAQPSEFGEAVVECHFTYTATVPELPVYTFALVDVGDATAVHDSVTVDVAALRTSPAPSLSVIEEFCPEC